MGKSFVKRKKFSDWFDFFQCVALANSKRGYGMKTDYGTVKDFLSLNWLSKVPLKWLDLPTMATRMSQLSDHGLINNYVYITIYKNVVHLILLSSFVMNPTTEFCEIFADRNSYG